MVLKLNKKIISCLKCSFSTHFVRKIWVQRSRKFEIQYCTFQIYFKVRVSLWADIRINDENYPIKKTFSYLSEIFLRSITFFNNDRFITSLQYQGRIFCCWKNIRGNLQTNHHLCYRNFFQFQLLAHDLLSKSNHRFS